MLDVNPISDRMITGSFKLGTSLQLNIINVYAPQAGRTENEKEQFYAILQQTYNRLKGSGPTVILGDLNARVGKAQEEWEKNLIGKHTFSPETANVSQQSEDVRDNRTLFVSFAEANDLTFTIV